MRTIINRIINCLSLACVFLFISGLSITIVHVTGDRSTDDEALAMIAFILVPFVLNYIIGNGIKLFNRTA